MIPAQEEILEVCNTLHTYSKQAELAQEKVNTIEAVQKNVAVTQLLVPVIGQFSAGKSTMINTMLGTTLLPTGITPETSLATEMHYTEGEEYAEGITENGTAHRYALSDMKKLTEDAKQYRFARVYIKNLQLKELEPLILVDMPGFDAPMEHHNKAILEYIDKGLYYIVLTKISDGTVSRTLLKRLDEIHASGRKFSLFLSNADLERSEKLAQVKQQCTDILQDTFGGTFHVEAINNTSVDSVLQCLHSIDSNALLKNLYYPQMNECTNTVLEGLNYRIKAFDMEASAIQSAQDELKRSIERVKSTAEQDIRHMKSKYSGSMVNNILRDITEALDSSADEITSAIMSQSGRAESLLNDIIRSSLVSSLERRVEEANDSIVMDFSDSVKDLSEVFKTMDIDLHYADTIVSGLQEVFKSVPTMAVGAASTQLPKAMSGLLSGTAAGSLSALLTGTIGSTITTATSVVATVINPLLGIAVAAVPLLMSLFGQKTQQDTGESQVRAKVTGEVFPQIKSKLRAQLPALLQEQVGGMITQVQQQYQRVLQSQQAEFEKAMQEKQESVEANKQKKELFVGYRQEVQRILEKITTWRME